MKKIVCFILCAMILMLSLAACSKTATTETGDNNATARAFTIVDKTERKNVTATFSNTDSGNTLDVEMKKDDSSDGEKNLYTCKADTSFDRVVVKADSNTSIELAFNDYVTGWENVSGQYYPYIQSGADDSLKTERKVFDYEEREKNVFIWTPADYDPKSEEKYSVIYMPDGQNLFVRAATSTGSWGVAESALAMAENGGGKCIIVGIETDGSWRDSELTPDLGDVRDESYADGHGKYFSDFVVDTVMPYINENYNVYTDREHTHVCGSSSGGIESFYIAMEHPDKFGSVGALSPAFILYSDDTWVDYLKQKDFSAGYPTVYLYCGNSKSDDLERMLYTGTVSMPKDLQNAGYPEDKVITKLYDDGVHKEAYWRAIFTDSIKYAFPKEAE